MNQETRLGDLVQYKLKAVRSYLLKEDFEFFWEDISPFWAGESLTLCVSVSCDPALSC